MIQIGAPLASDFTDPLGVLSDCHRRIERFLELLITVSTRANGGPLSTEQRGALETALRYFDEAAPKHTADEEASLFPRLRALLQDPRVAAALGTVEALERDHQAVASDHARVGVLVRRWLADGRLLDIAATELAARLSRLRSIYQRHIALEDSELFPLARAVLPASDVRAMGQEMASRRGLGAPAAVRRAERVGR